jgi:pectate lyase
MKKFPLIMGLLLMTIFILFTTACSDTKTAGSVSETTNGSVSGNLTSDDIIINEPLDVRLVPRTLSSRDLLPANLLIQTDSEGQFEFKNLSPGTYTLSIYDTTLNLGTLVEVTLSAGEDLVLKDITLQAMGQLYLLNTNNQYPPPDSIYIPELALYLKPKASLSDTLLAGSLPSGWYSQFISLSSTGRQPLLSALAQIPEQGGLLVRLDPLSVLRSDFGYYALNREIIVPVETLEVSTWEALNSAASTASPSLIRINGLISGTQNISLASNKIIKGSPNSGLDGFGFRMQRVRNIEIHNLSFNNANLDAIMIDSSFKVLVRHCSFQQSQDEHISIKNGADSISIAWNHFTDQQNVILIGNSDNFAASDSAKFHVSIYHNWFNNVQEQNPRIRFGTVHIFNNLYEDISQYAIASTMGAKVYVEKNVFNNVTAPTLIGHTSSEDGLLSAEGNLVFDSGALLTNGTVAKPDYTILGFNVSILETTLRNSVGP